MTAPAGLILLAVTLGLLGPRLLVRSKWPSRSPALGILAWQALSVAVFASVLLAGLSLAVPEIPASSGVAEFFHACSAALSEHYATPGGVVLSVLGGGVAVVLSVRFVSALWSGGRRMRRDRSHQDDMLRLVCSDHAEPDVVVVSHHVPAVYCLPGRRRQVVVTEGAIAALSPGQLRQVLAHEREHIRARHHLALLVADAFASALMNHLGTRQARAQIAELAEMHADDAADPSRRRELAVAVVLLAGGGRPAGALGADGGTAVVRVRRLAEPSRPVTRLQRLSVIVAGLTVVVLPLGIALAPGISAIASHYCPLF